MIKPIIKDTMFLSNKSVDATKDDLFIVDDLKDTLNRYKDICVGMSANMIGYNKNIIIVSTELFPIVIIFLLLKKGEEKMKILIIESAEYIYEDILDIIKENVDESVVMNRKSVYSGLDLLKSEKNFDLVITNDYLPTSDYTYVAVKMGGHIIEKIRKDDNIKNIPIIVCSREKFEGNGHNFAIKYSESPSFKEELVSILNIIKDYKDTLKEIEYQKDNNCKGTALIEHRTAINEPCNLYDPFGLCNITDCLYCNNCAYRIKFNNGDVLTNTELNIDNISPEHKVVGTDYDYEIQFYDYVPTPEDFYSYIFDDYSEYRFVRKYDGAELISPMYIKRLKK